MPEAMRLRQLFDVSSARPDDKDLLTWDKDEGKWAPQTQPNFDERYAPLVHTHDDRYYTKTLSDGRFAPLSHTHAAATTSTAGFMSSADKTKLNGVATNATSTNPTNSTPSTLLSTNPNSGSSGSSLLYARADHVHPSPGSATANRDGWMTMFDKAKLDGIDYSANSVHPAFANPSAITTSFQGPDRGSSLQYARADHVHGSPGLATRFQDGWMSAADKQKLDSL